MSRFREVVDAIQATLSPVSRGEPSPQLSTYAEEYAELCHRVNSRLRQCGAYLERGLRTEAIQLADSEPNLLEAVSVLDFMEAMSWRSYCEGHSLAVPPPLLLDTAAAVNEAYAEQQPLEGLMAYQRLMALARAPYRSRLAILRRISDLDPASPHWEDDVRAMERGRLDEIRHELPAMLRQKNAAHIGRLASELESHGWRTEVPSELKRGVQQALGQVQATDAEAALRALLPQLNTAYSAMDYDECSGLLVQCQEAAASGRIAIPDDVREQMDAASEWVNEETAKRLTDASFQAACDQLQQALDNDVGTPKLERAYQAAGRFPREMPPELDARYRQRIHARIGAQQQKRRLAYGGMAAAVLIVGAVITLIVYQSVRTREINESHAALTEALREVENGNPDRGRFLAAHLIEQHPRIAGEVSIAQPLAELKDAIAKEDQRRRDFGQHLQIATDAGVEHPNNHEIDLAASFAKTSEDTAAIASLRQQIAEYRESHQRSIDAQFVADATALTGEADGKLNAELLQKDPVEYEKELGAFHGQAAALAERSGVSTSLSRTQTNTFFALLKQKQGELERVRGEQTVLATVRTSTSSAADHVAALKAYVAECPTSNRVPDFRKAIEQLRANETVEEWSRLRQDWKQFIPETYVEADARVSQIEKYLKDYTDSPISKPAAAYLDYLKLGLKVADPKGDFKTGFAELLNNRLVRDLKVVQTTGDKVYYIFGAFDLKESRLNGDVVSRTFDAIVSPDITKSRQIHLAGDESLRNPIPVDSPQAIFARRAIGRLSALDYRGWESTGLAMTGDLLAQKGFEHRSSIHPFATSAATQRARAELGDGRSMQEGAGGPE